MKDLTGMMPSNEIKVIGLTGGIGSGKSEAAGILVEDYGALLLNMDRIAHQFMEAGGVSYELIKDYFGEGILDKDGNIDRGKLGREVYQNTARLKVLNSFTHPYVCAYVRDRIREVKEGESHIPYSVICVETALPKEAELSDYCDVIWYVSSDRKLRMDRLRENRNFDRDKFEQVLAKQLTEEEYKGISSHILTNNTTIEDLKIQIDRLLQLLYGGHSKW